MTRDSYDVLDLKALRCFWAAATHGNLTRAGIELGISESAVVALGIFVLHLLTLCVLTLASAAAAAWM